MWIKHKNIRSRSSNERPCTFSTSKAKKMIRPKTSVTKIKREVEDVIDIKIDEKKSLEDEIRKTMV